VTDKNPWEALFGRGRIKHQTTLIYFYDYNDRNAALMRCNQANTKIEEISALSG
jgi:hypothetical protein